MAGRIADLRREWDVEEVIVKTGVHFVERRHRNVASETGD
jgi:hypothetical protein